MERVFKAVPGGLREKMEALVHDLTLALEESTTSANVRRRWGIRRRAHSTGNIPSLHTNRQSDDSSSSVCDRHIPKSAATTKYQSDSDDTNQTKRLARFSNSNNASNIESDSVNENFVPRINPRRKRKFKRMAVDPDVNPSTSQTVAMSATLANKMRILRDDSKNKYVSIWCGKRKRSCREKSMECAMRTLKPNRNAKPKNRVKMQTEDSIDCSKISSSSISSSDSETGVVTNDEDREGDDEQSDWIGESSWWDDCESIKEDKLSADSPFRMMLHGNFEHDTFEARKYYRKGIQRIQESARAREIRVGRRHVDNKPGYSIITSANEKVSRFLQDPTQSELKLHPMRQQEREKLRRLANLYSLSLKGDLGCPILYKTRHTTQAICVDQVSFNRFADYKRLRRTPPNSPNAELVMHNQEHHLSSTSLNSPIISPVSKIDGMQALPPFAHFKWDSNSMDVEMYDKPKLHDFEHSKSS